MDRTESMDRQSKILLARKKLKKFKKSRSSASSSSATPTPSTSASSSFLNLTSSEIDLDTTADVDVLLEPSSLTSNQVPSEGRGSKELLEQVDVATTLDLSAPETAMANLVIEDIEQQSHSDIVTQKPKNRLPQSVSVITSSSITRTNTTSSLTYSPIKSPRPLPQLPDIAFPSPLPASPSLLKPITFDKIPQADLDIKDQPLVATSLSASNPRSSSPVRGRPLPIPPAPIEKTDKVNAIKSESVPGNIHVASKSSSASHNQPSLPSKSSPASSIFQRSSSETFANVADILNSYSGPSYQPQLSNFNQKKPVEQGSTRRTRSASPARKSSQRRSSNPLVSNVSVGELIDQYGYIERVSNRASEELKTLMLELTKEAQKISVATTAGTSMGEAISPHLRCHEATMDVVSSYTNIISPNQASSPGKPPADFVPGNHSSRSPTNARESITSVKPEGNSLTQIEYDADVDDTEPEVRGRTVLKDTLRATKTKSKSRTRTIPNNMISEVPGSESSQGIIKSPSKLPNVLDSFVSQYSSMESPGENFDKSDVKFSDSTPTVAFTNITDPRVTSTTYAQTVTAATLTSTTQTPPLTSKSNQAQNPGRVKFLETMLDSLKSELLKQQSHRKTLETKLSQLENETQTLTIAKVTLESTVSDLQQQLDISRSTQVESKQQIYPHQSSPQLSRVSTENSTLKAQLLQLQSELNVMRQEKSQMEKTVQHNVRRINSSLDRLLEDKATLEKQYLELKTRYDDVCSDLTDRKNKMVNTNDEIDKLRHERDIEITKRKEQVLQERRKYEIEEKRIKDLQGNLNDREEEIKMLQKKVDRKDCKINELTDTIDYLQSQQSKILSQLQSTHLASSPNPRHTVSAQPTVSFGDVSFVSDVSSIDFGETNDMESMKLEIEKLKSLYEGASAVVNGLKDALNRRGKDRSSSIDGEGEEDDKLSDRMDEIVREGKAEQLVAIILQLTIINRKLNLKIFNLKSRLHDLTKLAAQTDGLFQTQSPKPSKLSPNTNSRPKSTPDDTDTFTSTLTTTNDSMSTPSSNLPLPIARSDAKRDVSGPVIGEPDTISKMTRIPTPTSNPKASKNSQKSTSASKTKPSSRISVSKPSQSMQPTQSSRKQTTKVSSASAPKSTSRLRLESKLRRSSSSNDNISSPPRSATNMKPIEEKKKGSRVETSTKGSRASSGPGRGKTERI